MGSNLYSANSLENFWQLSIDIQEEEWENAITAAAPILDFIGPLSNSDSYLEIILGEGQFGKYHWQLKPSIRFYYLFKHVIPDRIILWMRQQHSISARANFPLNWPIEDRYVHFQWEVVRQLLLHKDQSHFSFTQFWPYEHRYAFVLTHDIESDIGQDEVRRIAEFEMDLGFRSSFYFTPEKYDIDQDLLAELIKQGFEVGIHGLRHDGRLFNSKKEFLSRIKEINKYLKKIDAVGFRSPFCLRNPDWMQSLEIEYDLSFFDTDPFEPIPGGTMSIWPFMTGHFMELPYTLVQDHSLVNILGEQTPRIWLEKVNFIENFHGMVLLNTHPDYLLHPINWSVYSDFLHTMKDRIGYWHALPKDVATWWRERLNIKRGFKSARAVNGKIGIAEENNELIIDLI